MFALSHERLLSVIRNSLIFIYMQVGWISMTSIHNEDHIKGGMFVEEKTIQEWKSIVTPALFSKQSDFKLIGYSEVTMEEIWSCLEEKVWKGNPTMRLHEVVQDIFHLPTATYMSFITVNALKVDEDDLLSSIQAINEGEQQQKS